MANFLRGKRFDTIFNFFNVIKLTSATKKLKEYENKNKERLKNENKEQRTNNKQMNKNITRNFFIFINFTGPSF